MTLVVLGLILWTAGATAHTWANWRMRGVTDHSTVSMLVVLLGLVLLALGLREEHPYAAIGALLPSGPVLLTLGIKAQDALRAKKLLPVAPAIPHPPPPPTQRVPTVEERAGMRRLIDRLEDDARRDLEKQRGPASMF